jgi:TetR/AcrR family transcriptional regulator
MGILERKEREREHRREEIITAAQRIFFEKGLQAATMDEIAEAAELSKGTLYLYYKSKEDLYLAVMIRGMDILAKMFEEVNHSDEPVLSRLQNLGRVYQEFCRGYPNYFRMFRFFENPLFHTQVSEEMNQLCTRSNQRVWKVAIDLLEDGIKQGLITRELTAPEIAIILWSTTTSLLYRLDSQNEYWKETMGVDLERVLEKSNRLVFEAILTPQGQQEYKLLLKEEGVEQ